MGARRGLVVGVIAAVTLVGCGSSSKPSTADTANGSPTSSTPAGSVATSTSPASSSSTKPFPAACTLLTKDDVSSLFGTTALDATPNTGPAPGVASCSFGLSVGSQGLNVTITTHTNYADDPSYVFPQQGTSAAGIGDSAIISTPQEHVGDITVKLGQNALEINVQFYTKPVDNAFLTQLAKAAVARL